MFVKGADSNGADPDNWNQLIAGKVKSHLGHYFNNLGYYNAKIGYLGKISEIFQKIAFFPGLYQDSYSFIYVHSWQIKLAPLSLCIGVIEHNVLCWSRKQMKKIHFLAILEEKKNVPSFFSILEKKAKINLFSFDWPTKDLRRG